MTGIASHVVATKANFGTRAMLGVVLRIARIGIFGGTFDPVHVGHLVAAINARHALGLDEVRLVVANEPWQKTAVRHVTPAKDRLALAQAAVSGTDGLVVSAVEIERGGPSYTADTVAEFKRFEPESELFLLVGADVVSDLASWERIDEVRRSVTLVVINRPGTQTVEVGSAGPLSNWRAESIEIPALEISSTDLRDRAASGRPLDFLVPAEAVRLIRSRRLYGDIR